MTAMRPFLLALLTAGPLLLSSSDAQAQDDPFIEQILDPEIAADERGNTLEERPELFLQMRFAQFAIPGAESDYGQRNFQLTRAEARWSGQLSPRVGVGFELQFHPLLDGSPEEIVNDAFVEYYATSHITLRAGQFIKPFGFDIQQSSSEREYPERGMFAGYFFPGQRDRGIEAMVDVHPATPWIGHTQLFVAVVNGNRFWNDNDDRLDVIARVRRQWPRGLAIGASLQVGSQLVPPGVTDDGDVLLTGLDAQWVIHRVAGRVEWAHGTRPSTLLSLDPLYTTAFTPGSTTDGVSASILTRLDATNQIFSRIDQLTGDPMTGARVRAFDIGYRHFFSAARVSINHAWKSAPTVNDDAVDTRLQVTFGITF